jgi:hypothetical protein
MIGILFLFVENLPVSVIPQDAEERTVNKKQRQEKAIRETEIAHEKG